MQQGPNGDGKEAPFLPKRSSTRYRLREKSMREERREGRWREERGERKGGRWFKSYLLTILNRPEEENHPDQLVYRYDPVAEAADLPAARGPALPASPVVQRHFAGQRNVTCVCVSDSERLGSHARDCGG